MASIFTVDDDSNIRQLISEYLRKDGHSVEEFASGDGLIERIRSEKPDCLILDIMMPGVNGFQLLSMIRSFSEMPIIMVSARGEAMDRIMGLELGCNDFLGKPFHPRELVGRVNAILRLVGWRKNEQDHSADEAHSEKLIKAGNLLIHEEYRQIKVQGGKELTLTSREYELLLHFAKHPNRPYSREQLIQQVWDYDFFGDVRVVDELIKRLRRKIAEVPSGFAIETVWGFGYKATVSI
ncbi:response regulator transcription factor [Ferviditalea candida]|uniref:Response regulator transcription factor n=1 Tax=Ferviditalea candida TaxID=3108399 RepID=A0ABU5ZIQ7_9BACL|nr:response regulator transcription factor [Paenibacillaceae bacterium T2]